MVILCCYSDMEALDGDDALLRDRRGRVAARDIVQFVPFRDFPPPNNGAALAQEVLAEIPEQLVGYMKMKKIAPGGGPLSVQ